MTIIPPGPHSINIQDIHIDKYQCIVHRGHSYHVDDTLDMILSKLSNTNKLIFLGSCGGFNHVSTLVEKSNAHMIATKGTGTMLINDPLLYDINENLLKGEDIIRNKMWSNMNERFSNNTSRPFYVNPSKNIAMQIIKQYNILNHNPSTKP